MQKQISRLIAELQQRCTAILFRRMTGVVAKISQKVSVLYAGKIEQAIRPPFAAPTSHAACWIWRCWNTLIRRFASSSSRRWWTKGYTEIVDADCDWRGHMAEWGFASRCWVLPWE